MEITTVINADACLRTVREGTVTIVPLRQVGWLTWDDLCARRAVEPKRGRR